MSGSDLASGPLVGHSEGRDPGQSERGEGAEESERDGAGRSGRILPGVVFHPGSVLGRGARDGPPGAEAEEKPPKTENLRDSVKTDEKPKMGEEEQQQPVQLVWNDGYFSAAGAGGNEKGRALRGF